jgi:uridine kinase
MNFLKNPLFILGAIVKIFFIFMLTSAPILDWYAPFLDNSIDNWSLDPWSSWINNDYSNLAFPYGYVMWFSFLPLTLIGKLFSISSVLTYGFTLFLIDIFLTITLFKLFANRELEILYLYWLSPIVFIGTYIFGLNDLVPIFFLVLSLFLLKNLYFASSGFILMAAISAKISILISLPVFLIYFINNSRIRIFIVSFFKGIFFGFIIFIAPFLLSESGISMILSNPEVQKIYTFSFDFGNDTKIYFVHLLYLVMLYNAWRVKRLNYDLFYAMLGITFFIVILFVPSSPGWFIWIAPFLLTQVNSNKKHALMIIWIFSALFVINNILNVPFPVILNYNDTIIGSPWKVSDNLSSIIYTLMIGLGIVLANRMWRETIIKNDYFRLSQKPFAIGIAGDSGSGKDTAAEILSGLFGKQSVSHLSGDSYHLWDRKKPMWKVMTHLNPMANDLDRFSQDLISLSDGKAIRVRDYDHSTGKMTKEKVLKSNDFIIASGLHAIYLPILREYYNLTIYLNMDEELRQFYKIQRDTKDRGHSSKDVEKSLENRKIDSERYIQSQSEFADLIFSLKPVNDINKKLNPKDLKLRLEIIFKNGLYDYSLVKTLIGVCGLDVDMETIKEGKDQKIKLLIDGDTDKDDIEIAVSMLCPEIMEFLDVNPKWDSGMNGVIQLVVMTHINQALKRRFLK